MKNKFLTAMLSLSILGAATAYADQSAVSMSNELLKGELSAVETYQQALKKVGDEPGAADIRAFLGNHQEAVRKLTEETQKLGGVPSTSSGAWGLWSKTVMGSAKILGDKSALKALKEGEEHGVKEYQEALDNKNTPASLRDLIQSDLMPRQRQHIQTLDTLINQRG